MAASIARLTAVSRGRSPPSLSDGPSADHQSCGLAFPGLSLMLLLCMEQQSSRTQALTVCPVLTLVSEGRYTR